MSIDSTASSSSDTGTLALTSFDAALPAPLSPAAPAPTAPDPTSLDLDDDPLGDEIAELSAHIDAAIYRLLTLILRYDEEGRWAWQGFRSCAHWLSWRTGLSLGPPGRGSGSPAAFPPFRTSRPRWPGAGSRTRRCGP